MFTNLYGDSDEIRLKSETNNHPPSNVVVKLGRSCTYSTNAHVYRRIIVPADPNQGSGGLNCSRAPKNMKIYLLFFTTTLDGR